MPEPTIFDEPTDQCEICLDMKSAKTMKALYIKTWDKVCFICPSCYGKADSVLEFTANK